MAQASGADAEFAARLERVQGELARHKFDYLLIGPSSDMVYLIDFPVRQSERMTILVIPREGMPRLVMPGFELPRVQSLPPFFEPAPWEDGDDPSLLLASLLQANGAGATVGVGGQLFSHFFFRLQAAARDRRWRSGDLLMEQVRMRKSPFEVDALRAASQAADAVFRELITLPVLGMTERELLAEIHRLLLEKGHDMVGGGIVGFGPNGASPHHHATDKRSAAGDPVVVDFGGVRQNYRSDITRTFHLGEPSGEFRRVYEIVAEANEAAFQRVKPGVTAEELDAVARDHIAAAGYGDAFLHRLGHGIGLDGHEAPYLVRGDATVLDEGMTFSVEPGIYLEGRFGVRIEDIAVVTHDGAERLNGATHELQVL